MNELELSVLIMTNLKNKTENTGEEVEKSEPLSTIGRNVT